MLYKKGRLVAFDPARCTQCGACLADVCKFDALRLEERRDVFDIIVDPVACTGCHGLDVVLQNRFDEDGWRKILKDTGIQIE